ncbi:DUF2460 domain-containing protein [Sneathiella marina]|uniref:DUF2460 domain-containing protein n=1 Tax=Sneathiella marina TaxID=2950108 RepID=A0ABY4VYC0_9PROT|nr:DUF2460 domain-containing protein [Sneathiella marina]USG59930.1 DUF2460 domain-containing protein [Sneathiella marina]
MSFHDVRFPTTVSYGASGGPRFSTTVQVLNSGHEQRNINWAQARRDYSVDLSPSRGAEWTAILNFFHARRGRAYGFRLKDFSDFRMPRQTIGTGNGVQTEFQIFKRYVDEDLPAAPYDRLLNKIAPGTVHLYLSGSEQASGWSVDATSGILSLELPPAEAVDISLACEFDVPVRFDTDLLQAVIPGPDVHHWQSIKLVEIRL